MKKTIFFISLFATLLYSIACTREKESTTPYPRIENTHRIMSYNIHHGRGMDDVVDIPRISDVINDVSPDVVGLQEVDSVVNRSGNIDVINSCRSIPECMPPTATPFCTMAASMATAYSPRRTLSVKRSVCPAPAKRTAQIVELSNYVVINTHLSLNGEERLSRPISSRKPQRNTKPIFLIGTEPTPDSAPMLS